VGNLDDGVSVVRLCRADGVRSGAVTLSSCRAGKRVFDRRTRPRSRVLGPREEAWGEAWQDCGLVFTREDGSALRPDYVSHLFGTLVERAELPRIRLHDLRHTNASLALAAGVPLKVVSQRLGHSTTAITSDLYTHVIPIVAREAADRIAALIGEPMEARPTEVEKPLSSANLARDPDSDGETNP